VYHFDCNCILNLLTRSNLRKPFGHPEGFFILIAIANQVFTIFARLAGFIILPLAQE